MKLIILSAIAWFLLSAAPHAYSGECLSRPNSYKVHWSVKLTIPSPNCQWTVDIQPGSRDVANATLQISDELSPVPLFSVERDGLVYWKSQDLLVFEDHQYENKYRLQFFDLGHLADASANALQFDALIRRSVDNHLNDGDEIDFYFPEFVSWTTEGIAVSVGVKTTQGGNGPYSTRCYGFVLAPRPARIVRSLTPEQLRAKYHVACQEFP